MFALKNVVKLNFEESTGPWRGMCGMWWWRYALGSRIISLPCSTHYRMWCILLSTLLQRLYLISYLGAFSFLLYLIIAFFPSLQAYFCFCTCCIIHNYYYSNWNIRITSSTVCTFLVNIAYIIAHCIQNNITHRWWFTYYFWVDHIVLHVFLCFYIL